MGLDSTVYPGAQLLVIRNSSIVYNKSFGYHTYEHVNPVKETDLYDLASITKTIGGTLALMHLHDKNQFDIDAQWKDYFPYFKKSEKGTLDFKSTLAHQAGLIPYIPFWTTTKRKNGKYKCRTFKSKKSKRFPIKITDKLFLHKKYKKKIYKGIKKSEITDKPSYKYSGLSFLLFPDLVKDITGIPFDKYLYDHFYDPIGADRLLFNPIEKYPLSEIIPTEMDSAFRKTLVHGYVHDENAAMLGGISSNAGLFSNALDLSKVLQMLLNKGQYGGKRYISESTIDKFTSCVFCDQGNRRGLGFDKPLIEYDAQAAYVSKYASPQSYGHSGFTGTFYWVDPEESLIIVFLSNRVCPTRKNIKLYSLNFRPQLHDAVYKSIR